MIVVKIGGSLIKYSNTFKSIIDQLVKLKQLNYELVVVCGLGEFKNVIKSIQEKLNLSDVDTHWLCLNCMRVTLNLVKFMVGELATICTTTSCVVSECRGKIVLVDVYELSRSLDTPQSWEITSDSYAYIIANLVNAKSTILLKPVKPPILGKFSKDDEVNNALSKLIKFNIVDKYLPQLVKKYRRKLAIVNAKVENALINYVLKGEGEYLEIY